MSTNVFNSSAMTAGATATLGNGSSRHHHSVGNQSTMLFTPTPVAGTPLGMSNSPTAFPFPPPSPLFLSSLNLLQQSNHSHLQQLSPWLTPGPLSALSSLNISPANGKCLTNTKEFSDNNNNDLTTTNAQTLSPPKSKYRLVDSEGDCQSPSRPPAHKDYYLHEGKEKCSLDRNDNFSPTKAQVNNRVDNVHWQSSEAVESILPYGNGRLSPPVNNTSSGIGKLSDSKMLENTSLFKPTTPTFMMPPYVTNSNSIPSPTFPISIRQPTSPQTPTQHAPYGSHYAHYMLPPHMFSYYQQQPSSHSYSPTNQSQNSPISPFVVPNSSQSPSMISTACTTNSTTALFDTYAQVKLSDTDKCVKVNSITKEGSPSHVQQQQHQCNSSSQIIDLTSCRNADSESPVDCSKSQAYSPKKSTESKQQSEQINSLKRKSPDEPSKVNCSSPPTSSCEPVSSSSSSTSRKHHILKPPNINITECDYRNGCGSAFLPSPLFPHHFSSHLPSSPYTYLDHIPLSAPPIPPSHHNSSKCFDFANAQLDTFTFTSPHQLSSSSGKDVSMSLHLMNQINSTGLTSPYGGLLSKGKVGKTEMPNSIMKDSKKSCSSNGNTANLNESRVTFQVPQPLSKNINENQENRLCKEKATHHTPKSKSSITNNKRHSQYPEYFRKGSTIKLGNGGLKRVEELSTEDFTESATVNGRFKVELSEVVSIKEKSKKGFVRISFLVGPSQIKVSLDSPMEHPFFVYQKSWRSCSPSTTSKRYGLVCDRLAVGDIVVTLANKPPNQSPSKLSSKTSRSLSSSSGSLSSASSHSSLTTTTINSSNTSTINLQSPQVMKYPPPPAHVNKTVNSKQHDFESALNLDVKSKSPITKNNNRVSKSLVGKGNDEEDEEIDVENVDDETTFDLSTKTSLD